MQVAAAVQTSASSLPRIRGFLLRRRCDGCGTRLEPKSEVAGKKVDLGCPKCQREYVFSDKSDLH